MAVYAGMRPRHALLAVAPVIAALALPAAGQAATITPLKRCYAHVPTKGSQPLTMLLRGGVPYGRFLVEGVDGKASSVEGTFNAAGNAITALTYYSTGGGIDPTRRVRVGLEVREYSGPYTGQITGTGSAFVTNTAMKISDRHLEHPYGKRTWVISGLTPLFGKGSLYASWIKRGHKRVVRTVRLGRPSAGCGYLRVRRSAAPVRHTGWWKIYVHVGKKLHRKRSVRWSWHVYRF